MNKAVVQIKGHQYYVAPGDTLTVDGVLGEKDTKLTFDQVFLTSGESVEIGTPALNTKVTAIVVDRTKSPKIKVATYKAKSRYRKVRGHRQAQTVLKIDSISGSDKSSKAAKTAQTDKTTNALPKPAAKKPTAQKSK